MKKDILTFRDLIVWKKSMDMVTDIYAITKSYPREEVYGLVSQMRRCAISIPSNIAEGKQRGTRKDYRQFLLISFGSCAELETQLEISMRIGYLRKNDFLMIQQKLHEIMKMLNVLISKLKQF